MRTPRDLFKRNPTLTRNGTLVRTLFLPRLRLSFKDALSFWRFVKANYNLRGKVLTIGFLSLGAPKAQKLKVFWKKSKRPSRSI